MAGNGLDSGDSIRSSDKLRFFRGWNTDSSAGERNVRFSDLVTFLNSADSGLNAGTASSEDISRLEQNIGLNSLRDAVNGGWAYFNMIDGVADVFTDETGVDTGASTNATYDAAGDFYEPTPASSASLLLSFDGADGDTTTTDDTGTHSPTFEGTGAEIDDAQSVFGGASVFLNGTTGYVEVPASDDFAFGTGDFTIDYRIRYQSSIGRYHGGTGVAATQWSIDHQTATIIRVFVGGSRSFTIPSMSIGTWYHIAITRSGNNLRLFVNGTESTTGAIDVTGADITGNTSNLTLGQDNTLGFVGWMDEFRIIKGTAAWTTDFTPPVAAYALGASNMTLPSVEFTTDATPTAARGVVLYDPIDAVTLNTDLILEYSRDGGTTWTAATLEADAVFSGNVEILATEDVDISGQPVGSNSIIWRIRTDNLKDLEIHGVYTQWR